MNVAVCVVTLHLLDTHSLKEKRGLLQSLMTRLRGRFNASIAEVESQDDIHQGVLGISCVNTAAGHAQETIDSVVRFIESEIVGRAEVVDVQTEVLGGFDGL
ncbi:MAG: DUF503 domain-containing protein [Chloroflexi bacterium]|nr:DUF503 domain-containing protein [Chloroflexota bacterium]